MLKPSIHIVDLVEVCNEQQRIYLLRAFLADMPSDEALQFLIKRMERAETNQEFFDQMAEP